MAVSDLTGPSRVYPLSGNAAETKRLNDQHHLFLIYCDQTLIHPSIPQDNIDTIADIATGTGIWLEDVSKRLALVPTESGNIRSFDGFDLSSQQFPAVKQKTMSFHTHDLLQPFPAELHEAYDLVHLRFLFAALREDQLETAVRNLVLLLKPSGYIQWDDMRHFCTYNNDVPADLQITDQVVIDYITKHEISHQLPDLLPDLFKQAGLENIIKEEYPAPETNDKIAAARAIRLEMAAAMPPVFLRLGLAGDKAEAERLSDRNVKILERHFSDGWYPILPVVSVVAQKVQTDEV